MFPEDLLQSLRQAAFQFATCDVGQLTASETCEVAGEQSARHGR